MRLRVQRSAAGRDIVDLDREIEASVDREIARPRQKALERELYRLGLRARGCAECQRADQSEAAESGSPQIQWGSMSRA